ncbi:YtcA family lipoprotein [Hafnia alvei]|uniref:YtcA family lipoprotein n=1 Tax=Hafnia alvei TaxID=569 RepID=UPI0024329F33|nr:YtcA family lipoprotein [Hafnia alvei]MEB7891803.1 YtcA family lipoprotein [Hafnia alvei]
MVRQIVFFQKHGPILSVIIPCRVALHALIFSQVLSLTGCVQVGAPSFTLVGSFVPYWILCAALALILTIIVRVGFIKCGIDDLMPIRLVVYFCLMLTMTFVFSLFFL